MVTMTNRHIDIREIVEELSSATDFVDIHEADRSLEEAIKGIDGIEQRIDYARGKGWLSDIAMYQGEYRFSRRIILDAINCLESLRLKTEARVIDLILGNDYISLSDISFKERKEKEDRLNYLVKTLGVKGEPGEESRLRKEAEKLELMANTARVLCVLRLEGPFLDALEENYEGRSFNPNGLNIAVYRLFKNDGIDDLNFAQRKRKYSYGVDLVIRKRNVRKEINKELDGISLYNLKQIRKKLDDFHRNPDKEEYRNLEML